MSTVRKIIEDFIYPHIDYITELAVIMEGNPDGWMDDEIPYGRFDRYSLVIASEFADTAQDIGIEIPQVVRDNLAKATDAEGVKYRPCQYFRTMTCEGEGDRVHIHTEGSLSVTNDNVPARSPYGFSLDYVFEGREITV